jgi:hypothetical protein
MKDRQMKQFLSRGKYQWEGGGHNEKVKESQYDENISYSCMKIEQSNC